MVKTLNNNKPEIESKKLIRIKRVAELTALSKSYIYQLCKANQFPRSVQLIPGGSSVAWIEGEVINWIDERIQERDGGADNA